jgi:hypothetical protein
MLEFASKSRSMVDAILVFSNIYHIQHSVFIASQIQFPICKPEKSVHNKVKDYINAAPQANHYIGKSKSMGTSLNRCNKLNLAVPNIKSIIDFFILPKL